MIDHDDAERAVRAALADILPRFATDAISLDSSFEELGADSVDRVEIVTAARDELGLDRPLSDFAGLTSLETLVRRLSE